MISGHPRSRAAALSALMVAAALAVASCASPPPPPPPPAVGGSWGGPAGGGAVLPDWRASITNFDRDRLNRLDAAWSLALEQAARLPGSGDLSSLGRLLQPDTALNGVAPPPGDYRCRTIKLGSQGGEGLGYVVYGWFACRIEQTPAGLKISKLTGSQRQAGLLFPENSRRMVMLGSLSLGDEPPASSYGQRPDRDLAAVLERVGDARWRLAIPWPQNESNLDLLELIPA